MPVDELLFALRAHVGEDKVQLITQKSA
jgi:hypothetical protein